MIIYKLYNCNNVLRDSTDSRFQTLTSTVLRFPDIIYTVLLSVYLLHSPFIDRGILCYRRRIASNATRWYRFELYYRLTHTLQKECFLLLLFHDSEYVSETLYFCHYPFDTRADIYTILLLSIFITNVCLNEAITFYIRSTQEKKLI